MLCRVCLRDLGEKDFECFKTKKGEKRPRRTCRSCTKEANKSYDKCQCGRKKRQASGSCAQCWSIRNTPAVEAKKCSKCGEVKAVVEFGVRKHKGIDRVRSVCKKCASEYAKSRPASVLKEIKRRSYARSKARVLECADYRLRRYRASIRRSCRQLGVPNADQVAASFTLETVCEICGIVPGSSRLHVDHCHKGGRFRGFLCSSCNTAIGHFRESPELLRAAARYCSKHLG